MRIELRWVVLVNILVTGFMGAGCSADECTEGDCDGNRSATSSGSGDGSLAASCSSNEECGTSLTCAQGGLFRGLCTASCESSTDCQTLFGDGAMCESGYCTLACDTPEQCPAGHCALDITGTDYCAGGKAELSELCREDADCGPGLRCFDDFGSWGICSARCTSEVECESFTGNVEICVPDFGLCAAYCSLFRGGSDNPECPNNWGCYAFDEGSQGYCAE